MAQLDAHLTGDQEVAGSTPVAGQQHTFMTIDHEVFLYGHSLPLADSRWAVVGFWQKNVHYTETLRGLKLAQLKCG